ncbi:MAG: type I-C CRISPR-associated protein Cas5 [Candidatus Dadabacteria bacterium]|nr:MAG: type I-C CRISPR-associated protein Cas5 [Candidatus Dadabacteria bacterium]
MTFGVQLEIWGNYAAFNRPEMKVERVSYDVITPSAARGILEAIYWKPQIRWCIDRLHILAPIHFTQVRRNELSGKVPVKGASGVASALQCAERGEQHYLPSVHIEDKRQQRAARILRDVRYGIEAHIEILDPAERDGTMLAHPEAKHLDTFRRRATRGQFHHQPWLGCREFPAFFRILDEGESFPSCPEELLGERDLGYMLWDIEFTPDARGKVIERHRGRRVRPRPRFFRALMRDGVIEVPAITETRE